LDSTDERHEYGVTGFEIIGEVNGESIQHPQRLNLKHIESHRTEQGMAEHPPQVHARGNHQYAAEGYVEKSHVDGYDHRQHHDTSRHLIEYGGTALDIHRIFLVEHREQGCHERRDRPDGDAHAVTGIKGEDAHQAEQGDHGEAYLDPSEPAVEHKGLDHGGEESHQRVAHHADADIRGLDAAVKQHPVQAQQGTTDHQMPQLATADTRKAGEDQQDQGREEHAVPRDIYLAQRDELAEESRKSGQHHREMELNECFVVLCHTHSKGTTKSENLQRHAAISLCRRLVSGLSDHGMT
jgi:hypothetical protein